MSKEIRETQKRIQVDFIIRTKDDDEHIHSMLENALAEFEPTDYEACVSSTARVHAQLVKAENK